MANPRLPNGEQFGYDPRRNAPFPPSGGGPRDPVTPPPTLPSRHPGPFDPTGRGNPPAIPKPLPGPAPTIAPQQPASFMSPGGGLGESDVLENIFKQLGL